MTSNIVFIGLGNMGLPMAQNLVRAGHAVTGFDLLPASVRQFADGGGLVSDDQAAAIGQADIVITMLPASRHVLGAYLGDAGILAQARPGTLLIDCSTIST
ncbi:MAG: NAD(P)-binding domain-containing protein, partial [Janthinobacterium sp.]